MEASFKVVVFDEKNGCIFSVSGFDNPEKAKDEAARARNEFEWLGRWEMNVACSAEEGWPFQVEKNPELLTA